MEDGGSTVGEAAAGGRGGGTRGWSPVESERIAEGARGWRSRGQEETLGTPFCLCRDLPRNFAASFAASLRSGYGERATVRAATAPISRTLFLLLNGSLLLSPNLSDYKSPVTVFVKILTVPENSLHSAYSAAEEIRSTIPEDFHARQREISEIFTRAHFTISEAFRQAREKSERVAVFRALARTDRPTVAKNSE